MNTSLQARSKPARFLGVALSLAMSLSAVGVLVMPAMAFAATSTPVVDQQPLTVQPTIPPNVVLMLDDSGSMNADYMPDYGYIPETSNDAMIDAANNGLYYDPTITYSAPPKADQTYFTTQSDITSVPSNGINNTPPPGITGPLVNVNLTNYNSIYECDHSQNCGLNSDGTPKGYIYFSTLIPNASPATFDQSTPDKATCDALYASYLGATSGDFYAGGINKCTFEYMPGYFQYSTGAATSPSVHYVAASSADCGSMTSTSTPSCIVASDTSGAAAPAGIPAGQNIANWFAYYHTRILMAKSGLMTAFLNISPTYRIGFASINGNGIGAIPGTPAPFTFDDSTSGGGNATNQLAAVQPFGDGSAGTQKANFWSWIEAESAKSNTPLRKALQGAGKYYQTEQPWQSMLGDPGYSATGTNTPLACRASYTILTTDGFWNGDTPTGIGNADGTAGPTVTGPNNQTYTYQPAAPYSGGDLATSTDPSLADVAMYYWEHDLQDGSGSSYNLTNEVPTSTEDPAFWQHMTTFTMGLGFTPTGISPTGTMIDQIFDWADGGTTISGFSWPTPLSNSINNIADLAHAAVNGHGAFFSVKSPQDFATGIASALNRIQERVGTGASLAANSTQLTTGSVIYQSTYYTSTWKGNLKAFSINSVNGAIATTPTWQAAGEIPAAASRDIETWNGTAFVAFANGTSAPPSLSTSQLTDLGADAAAQQAMVNYLRGDASGEQKNGGTFRNRDTSLGDIVDSQPVYSGIPDLNEFQNQTFYGTIYDTTTSSSPFSAWASGTTDSSGTFTASAASTRSPLIFVAANDGMLHAFNASTGAEVYAYLPGAVITAGIAGLANTAYGTAAYPHQFYNDGQLTIADAYIDTGDGKGQSWHTILVGTTGRGLAESVYALDVTDPSSIKPLWERSAGDGKSGSNYIGQMVGKPVIAQTDYVAAGNTTTASSTWSVLIGNGYNSAIGQAALLQFNLATGALSVHTTTDVTTGNGLAAPVAWMDDPSNGVSDIAYAGDLHGQVWSFALNDSTGANPTPTSTGSLLFTAQDSGGKVQPITAGMLAGKDPVTSNVWLFFGTGEYLSSTDLNSTATQTWYGIIAQACTTTSGGKKGGSGTTACAANAAGSRSNLTQRTITAQTAGGSGALPARSVSSEVVNSDGTTDMTGKDGWYMDLLAPIGAANAPVQQGERMIDPNEFQGSVLIGVTRIPLVTDVCSPSGSGWVMALDPFTGAAPSGDFFDVNNDGYVNSGDRVSGNVAAGVGFSSLPNAPIFVGGVMETSFDNGTMSSITTAGSVGTIKRVTWRELVNP